MTQQPLNFRNKPLVHELKEAEKRRNKQITLRLILEHRLSEYRKHNRRGGENG